MKRTPSTKTMRMRADDLPVTALRHPFPARYHPNYRMRFPFLAVVFSALFVAMLAGSVQAQKEKETARDFLIFGTVFNDRNYALQGAKVSVRVAGEKKVRGDATSDRRGEFGLRVARGAEYEVTVEARGFETDVQRVKTSTGVTREDLVFHMSAKPAKGTGGKKQ